MNFLEKVKILKNHYNAGNFLKVIEGCKVLDKKFPKNSFVLNLSGMAFQGLNKHQKAIVLFELALKADNFNIAAMNNLANSLKHTEQFERADQIFKKILQINPNYINAYNNYANLKTEVNDVEGAIKLYKEAILIAKKSKIDPSNFLTHLAVSLQSMNMKEELIEVINEILNINQDNINAHKILSTFYKYSPEDKKTIDHINHMEKIFQKNNLSDDQRGLIAFALGKAYDDIKNFPLAFKFLSIGNNFYKKINKSNVSEEIKIMNNTIKLFENIDLNKAHKAHSNKRVIFICGMPRSGTTLTEQIIASHKRVYGAGEPTFLTNIIYENFIIDGKFDKQKLIEHQNTFKNDIYNKYFDKLSLYSIDKDIITDKAPFNFQWIGFIKIFFPNSKIIHCRRNAEDNCLSIYKNNFASSKMNWSYDQKDISNYYNNYSELMKFWNNKIENFIYTIDYEKVVSNKEYEIKKLLNFCELEWDDSCLNHHKSNKTPIRSVSISQARQPIYKSSVNSREGYKKYLREMYENLN